MDWSAIFKIIVDDIGVIPALLIFGLAFWCWRSERRKDELTDRLFDVTNGTKDALNGLSRSIDRDR